MKKCKISPATLARTAALALALTNQVLSATGHRVLPIESAELEQLVSTLSGGLCRAVWGSDTLPY